jgi:hypothetical protein
VPRFLPFATVLLLLYPQGARAGKPDHFDAWFGASLGQHFTGRITAPTFFPALEFRSGYRVTGEFTTRIALGTAITRVTGSHRPSFNDAGLMVGHASLGFLYTPEITPTIMLNLGGSVGAWLSSMWGDDLLDTTSGHIYDHLEEISVSYALVLGAEWEISRDWALTGEIRVNAATLEWGGDIYNTGGATVLLGFVTRMRTRDW